MSVNTLNRIKQLSESRKVEKGNLLQFNWECKQCKLCQKCNGPLDSVNDNLVLCKLCDRGYHEFCLENRPISKENFFCSSCQSFNAASLQSVRTVTPSSDSLLALQPKLPETEVKSLLGKDKEQARIAFTNLAPGKKQKTE